MLKHLLDSLSGQYGDQVNFFKLNVDDHMDQAERFGVKSLPTLIFFRDCKEVDRHIGMLQRSNLEEKLNNLM